MHSMLIVVIFCRDRVIGDGWTMVHRVETFVYSAAEAQLQSPGGGAPGRTRHRIRGFEDEIQSHGRRATGGRGPRRGITVAMAPVLRWDAVRRAAAFRRV